MALLFKCIVDVVAVLAIHAVSNIRNFYIAGPVPLFPTFALIAHYVIGTERNMTDLRTTALFGLASLIPYAVYLTVVYVLAIRMSLFATLRCPLLQPLSRQATCKSSPSQFIRRPMYVEPTWPERSKTLLPLQARPMNRKGR